MNFFEGEGKVVEPTTITVEGRDVDEARGLIRRSIPPDQFLISEKVLERESDVSFFIEAENYDSALAEAKEKIPQEILNVEMPVQVITREKNVRINVNALDENQASSVAWHEHFDDVFRLNSSVKKTYDDKDAHIRYAISCAKIRSIVTIRRGRKGIFGIGKKPGQYEVEIFQPAVFQIKYRKNAKVIAHMGDFEYVTFEGYINNLWDLLKDYQHYQFVDKEWDTNEADNVREKIFCFSKQIYEVGGYDLLKKIYHEIKFPLLIHIWHNLDPQIGENNKDFTG